MLKRRHFIRGATASVLLPAALGSPSLLALTAPSSHGDYALFDERFENARRIAASWPGSNEPIAVQGDITSLWTHTLERATRERPLHLRGVTTESFRFCLAILVREHATLDLQVARLDPNLFLWTMRTTPTLRAEPHNG
jgi:hypothetical protein